MPRKFQRHLPKGYSWTGFNWSKDGSIIQSEVENANSSSQEATVDVNSISAETQTETTVSTKNVATQTVMLMEVL